MKRVIVHIDRLVLKGFGPADRDAIASALHGELGRQLARPDAVQHVVKRGDIARIVLGRTQAGPRWAPDHIGARIARAVAGGLDR